MKLSESSKLEKLLVSFHSARPEKEWDILPLAALVVLVALTALTSRAVLSALAWLTLQAIKAELRLLNFF